MTNHRLEIKDCSINGGISICFGDTMEDDLVFACGAMVKEDPDWCKQKAIAEKVILALTAMEILESGDIKQHVFNNFCPDCGLSGQRKMDKEGFRVECKSCGCNYNGEYDRAWPDIKELAAQLIKEASEEVK